MLGDITIYQQSSAQGGSGSRRFNTAAAATLINAGEPVVMVAGATAVIGGATNLITIPSPYVPYTITGTGVVGVAETTSTNTASLAGNVNVTLANPSTVFLITANSATLVNTQAKYDALVGHRVLIDLTAGVYTALLADSALNGCLVQPLDVIKNPGKVAFTFISDTYAF
jgi:hypothetical protein